MKWLCIFTLTFYLPFAAAKNLALYFGAGGEPKAYSATIFDQSFEDFISFAQTREWSTEYFTSQNTNQRLIANKKAIEAKEFTAENTRIRFEELEKQIQSGQIQPGDQLLIALNTHGVFESDEYLIATSDSTLNPEIYLRRIIRLAEEKGIKVGLLGLTCFSGQLQQFGSEKTCVISVSGPDQLGWIYTSDAMALNLNYASNLEDVYTSARARHENYKGAQPEISTPAGQKTKLALKALKEYLSLGAEDTFTMKVRQHTSCSNYEARLKPLSEAITHLKSAGFLKWSEERILKEDIEKFKSLIKKYEIQLAITHNLFSACYPIPKGANLSQSNRCMNPATTRDTYYFFKQILNRSQHTMSPEEIDEVKKTIADIEFKFAEVRILPPLKNAINDVATVERHIYDKLYKTFSKESAKQPNPCRDFKLY